MLETNAMQTASTANFFGPVYPLFACIKLALFCSANGIGPLIGRCPGDKI